MSMAGPQMKNFHVRASFTALDVLADDPYFQEELPVNWQEIILKIRKKLLPQNQRAQFEEKLTELTEVKDDCDDIKAALPDAIKHLITALNNTPAPKPVSEAELEMGRSYLPSKHNAKNPSQNKQQLRPSSTCRDEERMEELNRHRPLLRPVH